MQVKLAQAWMEMESMFVISSNLNSHPLLLQIATKQVQFKQRFVKRLAAPKSQAILDLLTTLNTDAVDFWVGLDDRCRLALI